VRHHIIRSGFLFQLAAVLAFLLSGCSGGSQASTTSPTLTAAKPQYGGELRIAISSVSYLDPQKSSLGGDPLLNGVYAAYLLDISEDGELLPSVAESWSMLDPKTLVFKLRPGIKFHDGTDLDAAAVKFTIQRGQDPKTKAVRQAQYQEITQVETPDPLTVVLHLVAPDSSLLYTNRGGAGPIVSPTAVQKWGDDFERHVVSAGPFQFESYTPDSQIVFKRFENYFEKDKDGNKLPYLDRVVFKIIPDAAVQIAALESGDIDIDPFTITGEFVDRIKGNHDLTLLTHAQDRTSLLQWNQQKPPLDNLNLRKAIAYAIDRDELVKSIYGGYGVPAKEALAPAMWGHDPTIEGYNYDPAKAKDYLAKAGYPNGGVKLKAATYSSNKQLGEIIQAQLKRVGIEMSLDVLESVAYGKAFRTDGAYDIGIDGYTYKPDADANLDGWFSSNGYYCPKGRSLPQNDVLLAQGRASYDLNERKRIYSQLQRLINDDVQSVFLVNGDRFMATRNDVMGFTFGAFAQGDARNVWLRR